MIVLDLLNSVKMVGSTQSIPYTRKFLQNKILQIHTLADFTNKMLTYEGKTCNFKAAYKHLMNQNFLAIARLEATCACLNDLFNK